MEEMGDDLVNAIVQCREAVIYPDQLVLVI